MTTLLYIYNHRQTLQNSDQTDFPEFYRSLDSDDENSDDEEATENGHCVDTKPEEGTHTHILYVWVLHANTHCPSDTGNKWLFLKGKAAIKMTLLEF